MPNPCYNDLISNHDEETLFFMRHAWLLLQSVLIILSVPVLACGALSRQVTPTPTKTPKIKTLVPIATAALPAIDDLATNTPIPDILPTATPVPVPPTDTPTPEPPPTDTPTPEPPPTNTPLPPPPTNTPLPPPPTNTPAPPPPPPPPANAETQVFVELPEGSRYSPGDRVKIVVIVRDPDGIANFAWGIFSLNDTPFPVGGDRNCGGATECRIDEDVTAPPLPDTYKVGVDVIDSKGASTRGFFGEIYIN